MTWAAFYLACFVIGLALTLVSLVAGSVHLHIPHLHFGHGGHLAGRGMGRIGIRSAGPHGAHAQVPVVNFATMVAFLTWFGATGYVLTHFHPVSLALGLAFSFLGGITGLLIVFWFLAKLVAHDDTMQSADYDMVGVLGKITVPIREGGTGEIVYSQMGRRFCAAARSDGGSVIPKGTEVVVTRYEHGVAYVKQWEELTGEPEGAAGTETGKLQ
ncbi:MAG TPA: NfeD family protein [Terriglobales bacterium]|nr:NfeD family protein [Terriglobales bacterium]